MGNLGFHITMMCPTCNGEGVVNSVERDRAKACSAMADPAIGVALSRQALLNCWAFRERLPSQLKRELQSALTALGEEV